MATLLATSPGCRSSAEKDSESGFPRVPAPGTRFTKRETEGGKAVYYQAEHPQDAPAVFFRADKVDDEHWSLVRYERDGEKAQPEEGELRRISLVLDAVVFFPPPERDYPGAQHEHPLRAEFRDYAAGKKTPKWPAVLPRIVSDECPSARTRARFSVILIEKVEDPEKLGPELALAAPKLGFETDDERKAFATLALATRRPGVPVVALAVARTCSFDDAKLAILRGVLALPALDEGEQLELVRVAGTVSADPGKAEVLSALAKRTDLLQGPAVAIVDATRPLASATDAATILCAVIARGEVSQVLQDHLEPAIDRLPNAQERERCWKALDRARKKS